MAYDLDSSSSSSNVGKTPYSDSVVADELYRAFSGTHDVRTIVGIVNRAKKSMDIDPLEIRHTLARALSDREYSQADRIANIIVDAAPDTAIERVEQILKESGDGPRKLVVYGGFAKKQDLIAAGAKPQHVNTYFTRVEVETKYGQRAEGKKGRPPAMCRLNPSDLDYLFGKDKPIFIDPSGKSYKFTADVKRKPVQAVPAIKVEVAEKIESKAVPKFEPSNAPVLVVPAPTPAVQTNAVKYEKPNSGRSRKETERIKKIAEERGKVRSFESELDNLLSGTGKSRGDLDRDKIFDMMCAGLLVEIGSGHVYPINEERALKFALRTHRASVKDVARWCGETDVDKLQKLIDELDIGTDTVSLDGAYYPCIELGDVSEVLERYGKSFLE